MNNKGQSLVLFVIFIPLVLIIGAFVLDLGYAKYYQNKIDDINKSATYYALDNIEDLNVDKVKSFITDNDDSLKDINIISFSDDKEVEIIINAKVQGIFTAVSGKELYDVKSHFKGKIIDDKKVIERVD